MTEITDAPVSFGLIPAEHWSQPDWIDEEKAAKGRDDMVKAKVPYGCACHLVSRISVRLTRISSANVP